MNMTNSVRVRGALLMACVVILPALLCIRQQVIISRLTDERDTLQARQHDFLPHR